MPSADRLRGQGADGSGVGAGAADDGKGVGVASSNVVKGEDIAVGEVQGERLVLVAALWRAGDQLGDQLVGAGLAAG